MFENKTYIIYELAERYKPAILYLAEKGVENVKNS